MIKFLYLTPVLILCSSISSSAMPDQLCLQEPYESVTKPYLIIQQDLCADRFDGIIPVAQTMQKVIAADAGRTFSPDFAKSVDTLVAVKDLHSARIAFKAVSANLVVAFKIAKISTGGMLHLVYCPLAGATWIQTDPKLAHNPYYGTAMPNCGDQVGSF